MNIEPTEALPLPEFDRDLTLDDLLAGINQDRLHDALSGVLDQSVCLLDMSDNIVFGNKPELPSRRLPIRPEMEAIGYLEAGDDGSNKIEAAVRLIEMLFKSSARYIMASSLHLHAVNDDYEKLKLKHTALMESEARYKELTENLEQRVQEQVETIELTQRQLYQSEKLASVGHLAAGVAHEINNPIGFIGSNLSTAQDYLGDFKKFSEKMAEETDIAKLTKAWNELDLDYTINDFHLMLNESIDGAKRITAIVKDLKGFSDVDVLEEEMIDINECIQRVCNIASSEITKHANLVTEYGELPPIRCKPGLLGQVFHNILLNAGHAIKDSGEIRIKTAHEGQNICVYITDTGVGMSSEVLDCAFNPFFTTREVGSGAGLGLTVSRDIIQSHGGTIAIESIEGKETTVTVCLPVDTK
jgi:signal transduction histidine kinase